MKTLVTICFVVILSVALFCGAAHADKKWVIDAGPLTLDVSISETPTLFYIVDQLSLRQSYYNSQYYSYFDGLAGGLSDEDQKLLEQHAAICKKHEGSYLAFNTSPDLDTAIAKLVSNYHFTQQEAETELKVLNAFKARVDQYISDMTPYMVTSSEKLEAKKTDLADFAAQMSRFTGREKMTATVYLIPSPADSRGSSAEFNRGIFMCFVGKSSTDIYEYVAWDLVNTYLASKQSVLDDSVRKLSGLQSWGLSSSIAEAYSPGMLGDDGLDRLAQRASLQLEQDSNMSEQYTQRVIYALALQPLLKKTLEDGQTLEEFLPKAADAWTSLQALNKIIKPETSSSGIHLHDGHNYQADPRHSILAFGSIDSGMVSILAKNSGYHIFGRHNDADAYKELLTNIAKPGDVILLMLCLDDSPGVPAQYSDLLPIPWPDVEALLKKGATITVEGKARDMKTVLLATPTRAQLLKEFQKLANDPKAFGNPLTQKNVTY